MSRPGARTASAVARGPARPDPGDALPTSSRPCSGREGADGSPSRASRRCAGCSRWRSPASPPSGAAPRTCATSMRCCDARPKPRCRGMAAGRRRLPRPARRGDSQPPVPGTARIDGPDPHGAAPDRGEAAGHASRGTGAPRSHLRGGPRAIPSRRAPRDARAHGRSRGHPPARPARRRDQHVVERSCAPRAASKPGPLFHARTPNWTPPQCTYKADSANNPGPWAHARRATAMPGSLSSPEFRSVWTPDRTPGSWASGRRLGNRALPSTTAFVQFVAPHRP
jgi:hypothetical protein